MRLGLMLGYWNSDVDPGWQIEAAQKAEQLGYDSAWVAEGYGSDAVSVMTWIAAATSTIRIGSGVLQIPARSAAMTAMTAATLDVLSGGRMILGVGSSGPQVAEGWHGQRFGRQLARTRDYVEIARQALAGERVAHDGEAIQLPLPDGPGKSLKLMIRPVQPAVPIYVAAIGPRNTELCGEIADGIIPTFFSAAHADELHARLRKGADRAGRDPTAVDLAPIVNICISDDVAAARDAVRGTLALYVGGMGSRERNFYKDLAGSYGFADDAARVQDLYLNRQYDDAAAAVPDGLVDVVALCGTADTVRGRLEECRQAGVGTLILSPKAPTAAARIDQLRQVADLV